MDASTPVREKRTHLWEREPDNWYVEPEWVSRRLFEAEPFNGVVVDPCAGMGNIIRSAANAGRLAFGYDLRDRGIHFVEGGVDFFSEPGGVWPADNIISNPPYGHRPDPLPGERMRWEEEFIRLALARVTGKVAVFLDANWINSATRGAWLETLPLARVYNVGPRPSCPPASYIAAGHKPGGGRTDYAWYVFEKGHEGPPTLHWLRRDG